MDYDLIVVKTLERVYKNCYYIIRGEQNEKIGVLTSGGDAPGMNAAIRAVVKTAIANGIQPIGFIKGYNGILEKIIMLWIEKVFQE